MDSKIRILEVVENLKEGWYGTLDIPGGQNIK